MTDWHQIVLLYCNYSFPSWVITNFESITRSMSALCGSCSLFSTCSNPILPLAASNEI